VAPIYSLGNAYKRWHGWRLAVVGRLHPSVRHRIVAWALWSVHHAAQIHYTENLDPHLGPVRSEWDGKRPGALPIYTDCSGLDTYCYYAARAPDPNGYHYRQVGNTATALAHAHTVSEDIRIGQLGDLVVVGPGGGAHEVVIVGDAGSANPWVVSHGYESVDVPQRIRLLTDVRTPKRVCVSL
jgi:hypothetical protein